MYEDFAKNEEIDNVLREFDSRANSDQKLKQEVVYASETPKMVQLVMKFSGGYIKSKKQANYVLLASVFLIIAISFILITNTVSKKPKIIPHFREDIDEAVRAKLPPGVFETIPSKYDQQH